MSSLLTDKVTELLGIILAANEATIRSNADSPKCYAQL
jgi:hypothetical protein